MTKSVVIDIETTTIFENGKPGSPTPYDSRNQLVSVGYKILSTGHTGYLFFNHNECDPEEIPSESCESYRLLQSVLNNADQIVGHNLKFDMSWLYECGFKFEGKLYDTMIFEYVMAKGLKPTLKLKDVALRYELEPKKDILEEYFKQGINTNEIPRVQLEEYGRQDIETTAQLFELQRQRYKNEPDVKTSWPAIKLSNEALECLIDIERAGIKIDLAELDRVEAEFKQEQVELITKLTDMARAVMGDTPVNFASPEDMSKIVYSRAVKDKKQWKEVFGIGAEIRGSVKKAKYNKRYDYSELRMIMRDHMDKLYKTDAVHCHECDGKGYYFKKKQDGSNFKKSSTCKACDGAQVVYVPTDKIAGFKVKPISSEYATVNGFSTDKVTINDLIEQGDLTYDAEAFLKGLQRLNAIDTYLTSFVGGIRNGIRSDGLCHPNFNQCVTATGRLSSSGPNFQNFPRGSTFPIRKVFVSRWADIGGKVIDTDFAALEYRVAVMLAKCPAGLDSILNGKDRHQLSAEILYGVNKDEMEPEAWAEIRQKAKAGTFQPLYAGQGSTERSRAYAKAFYEEHYGIRDWHESLVVEALTHKQILCPDGQIFAFPDIKRNGQHVKGKTQLVNYPVQHFATFTIAWCVICELFRLMKEAKVQSRIILQVHDSVTVDTHPEEVATMQVLIKKAFESAGSLLTNRFGYVTDVPIGFEISMGDNLLDKHKLHVG